MYFIKIEYLSVKVLKCWYYFFKINFYILFYMYKNLNMLLFFYFLFFCDICGIVIYEDLINILNDIKIVIREIL